MNKEQGRETIAERMEQSEKDKDILTSKGHGETNIPKKIALSVKYR